MNRFSFRPRLESLDDRCLPSFVNVGTFGTHGMWPTHVGVTDVDGNTHLDVVVDSYSIIENWGEEGWYEVVEYREVLINGPAGSFGLYDYPGPPAGSDWNPDFNRDGIADRYSVQLGQWDFWDQANHNSSVEVQLGDGAGGFGVPQTVWSGSVVSEDAAAVGDFNGDGWIDLAVIHSVGRWGGVTILRNDGVWPPLPPPIPAIRINDVAVTEGHTGTRSATFTVSLSIAPTQPVTVSYATANGTATAGSDYESTSGTLTFAPGETTRIVTVPVNGDRVGEANETFVVNLSNPTNSYIADGQAVGTITDDEPRIRINDVARAEGRKGRTTLFVFTVTLSAAYDQPVTMSFATFDGSARTSNGDYVAKSGTLTFAPGETTKTITIEVKGDSRREYDEWFGVELSGNSSNSLFDKNWGVGEILNDD